MRVLVDTNVLLRWSLAADPQNALCQSAINHLIRTGAELCFTFQNIAEFWNVATRPLQRNGFGLTPGQAQHEVEVIERLFTLLPEDAVIYAEWRAMVADLQVSGVQVHDARLAAAMVVHNVSHLLTFNKSDFARFSGLTALDPADVLAQRQSSS